MTTAVPMASDRAVRWAWLMRSQRRPGPGACAHKRMLGTRPACRHVGGRRSRAAEPRASTTRTRSRWTRESARVLLRPEPVARLRRRGGRLLRRPSGSGVRRGVDQPRPDPRVPWLPDRVGETVVLLVAVLVESLLLLAPGQSRIALGVEVITIGAIASAVVTAAHVRLRRHREHTSPVQRRVRIVAGQLASLPALGRRRLAAALRGRRALLDAGRDDSLGARRRLQCLGATHRSRALSGRAYPW